MKHIAIIGEGLSDINAECEKIRSDWFGRKIAFVKDLGGQSIELKERS